MAEMHDFFERLLSARGSDLHLEQGQPPKMRSLGHLHAIDGLPILTEEYLGRIMEEVAPPALWKSFVDTGDADFACELPGKARFRANYYRHHYGFGAVFRMIPSKVVTLEELGMPPVLKKFATFRSGLCLVTGPTGSGKSTTLAAILDYINTTVPRKIMTIEEPVEFIHQSKKGFMVHREVGSDTASFASGLRAAMKSDAEIVLVGELRDLETIRLALTAAQMGILVFGTLHTNSAPKTIDRIVDVFPVNEKNQARMILSNVLKGVMAQQLIPSADGKRRVASYELMFQTMGMSAIIAEGDTIRMVSEIQMNGRDGMILMDDCLVNLVLSGQIRREDALVKARDKNAFQARMAGR